MAPSSRSFVRGALALPVALALVAVLPSPSAHPEEPRPSEFRLLGDFPGGLDHSVARGVSADGSVVVGESYSAGGLEAFRWTEAGGLEGLGDLPGGSFTSAAYAVSGDGTTIVGSSQSAASAPVGQEAFAWTAAGGMVALGDLPGNLYASVARAASHDGAVLAGTSASFANLFDACVWEDLVGPMSIGGLGGGFNQSDANGVSGDGTLVVGRSTPPGGNIAFTWTSAGGMVALEDLSGGDLNCNALAVSADGRVIVGHGTDDDGQHAVRWVDGTIELLGDLPGGNVYGRAYACSADGSVVVGTGFTDFGADAFIWTAEDGLRSLRSVLDALGVRGMEVFTVTNAYGISADGTVIVGEGYDASGAPQAWRAVLGDEPPKPDALPLLVTKLKVKDNERKPERSRLIVEGFFDVGVDPVDLGAACEVRCGMLPLGIASLEKRPNGSWRHVEEGLKVDLVPSDVGSSLVRLRLKRKGRLDGQVPPDGVVEIFSTVGEAERVGRMLADGGAYAQGGKGELVEPGLFLTSLILKSKGRAAPKLKLEASLAGEKPPPTAPSVRLELADGLSVTVPGNVFEPFPGGWRFKGDFDGISMVVLDWWKERMILKGKRLQVGEFPDGPHSVRVRLVVGEAESEAIVRMISKQGKLQY